MKRTIARLPPLVGTTAAPLISVQPKQVDPFYLTDAYRAWREQVIARAGRRCEAIDSGMRCEKAEPRNRMFADHKVEVSDRGAKYDINNGQCLCGRHHSLKTARARVERARG